jgi:rhamnosyltransferase
MSAGIPAARRVTAVVAAFRPDDGLRARLDRVARQVDAVVVVDDGSGPDWAGTFADLAAAWPDRVRVAVLDRNSGIAAALNRGVQLALEDGCDAVLTLDQDSTIDDGYVDAALAAADRLASEGRPFGAIAAGVQSGDEVRATKYGDRGDRITPTLEAIQSGLLVPVATFDRVGLFDETLFIDCVDTDFLLRTARAGLPTYLARACAIEHPLGRSIETPGMRVTRSGRGSFAYHPAWRRYYITRNRAVVLARHGLHEPRWAASNLAGEAVQYLRCVALGPDKGRQLAALPIGLADAALRRRGRLRGRAAAVLGGPR